MKSDIRITDLSKSFRVGIQDVSVLKNINITVEQGDFVIIFGPSGCGKSTFLHTLLGLEPPTSGNITILENNIYNMTTEDDRGDFRKRYIGMIYQEPNWVKSLNVIENVCFPLTLLGINDEQAKKSAINALEKLGMAEWMNYLPSELSSGQQQKIALARGLINEPKIIVADEPTGNLDYESGQEMMELLVNENKSGKTIIMVTHDLEYLVFAKTAIQMFNGKIQGVYKGSEVDELSKTVKGKRGFYKALSLHNEKN